MSSSSKNSSQTQTSSNTLQNDNRVAAADSGIALGTGATLDQSFTDASQTTIQTTDARDFSTYLNDESQTTIQTTDARNQSVNYADYSTHTTLDKELAEAALGAGGAALRDAGDVLEKQIASSEAATRAFISGTYSASRDNADAIARTAESAVGFAGDTLEGAFALAEKLSAKSVADAAAAREQSTEFLSAFYRDRESGDAKVTGDLVKYGTAAAIVGLLAWSLK